MVLTLRALVVVVLAAALVEKLVGRHRLHEAQAAFRVAYGSPEPSAWDTTPDRGQANAARLIQAALLALDVRRDEHELLRSDTSAAPQEWTARRSPLAKLVERNYLALELVHQASDIRYSCFGFRYSASTSQLSLDGVWPLTLLLSAEARLARERNDPRAAVRALRAQARLASAFTSEGPLIAYLVGVRVEIEALDVVTAWLQDEAESPGTVPLADVEAALPASDLVAGLNRTRAVEAVTFGSVRPLDEGPLFAAYFWPIRELMWADILNSAVRGAPLSPDEPLAKSLPSLSATAVRCLPCRAIAAVAEPPFARAAATAGRTLSRRLLVRAALEVRALGLRAGTYPASRPDLDCLRRPDPLGGRLLVYTPRANGSVAIGVEEAALPKDLGSPIEPIVLAPLR